VAVFVPSGVVLFGLDDTIERRRGEQITAKGIYRDPVRSSHAHMVKAIDSQKKIREAEGRVEWTGQ
jgi:hypothetical protein